MKHITTTSSAKVLYRTFLLTHKPCQTPDGHNPAGRNDRFSPVAQPQKKKHFTSMDELAARLSPLGI
jgi:hypothetical protein